MYNGNGLAYKMVKKFIESIVCIVCSMISFDIYYMNRNESESVNFRAIA